MASPETFRNTATNLRQAAAANDGDAAGLARWGAVFADWLSPAAEHFSSHQYEGSFRQYAMVTDDFNDAAAILEDLATQLETKLAEISRVRANVLGFFASPPAWTIDPDDPTPIWHRGVGWRWTPSSVPADATDPAWIGVGHHFRNVYGINV